MADFIRSRPPFAAWAVLAASACASASTRVESPRAPAGPTEIALFPSGADGYHTFRIPSLTVTLRGTLLAFAEGRREHRQDYGDIDLVLRRSFDGGASWQPLQIVWDDGLNTCGNPTAVVDRTTGTIWLLMTHNLGHDRQKQIVERTSEGTRTVWVTRSDDDGATWARPVEITATVKRPEWTWYGTGEGVGIQTRDGRLLIPGEASAGDRSLSVVFESADHGRTWNLIGTIGATFGESQLVELADGSLLINMRAHLEDRAARDKLPRLRGTATSRDGGRTWSPAAFDPQLVDPLCQGSLIRYTLAATHGKNRLLFSNPASGKREKLTVRLSYDEGKTWPVAKVIHEGRAAYSSLAVLRDATIGLLYERSTEPPGATTPKDASGIVFARFSLAWLTDGADVIGAR